jgi:hypothetical protein
MRQKRAVAAARASRQSAQRSAVDRQRIVRNASDSRHAAIVSGSSETRQIRATQQSSADRQKNVRSRHAAIVSRSSEMRQIHAMRRSQPDARSAPNPRRAEIVSEPSGTRQIRAMRRAQPDARSAPNPRRAEIVSEPSGTRQIRTMRRSQPARSALRAGRRSAGVRCSSVGSRLGVASLLFRCGSPKPRDRCTRAARSIPSTSSCVVRHRSDAPCHGARVASPAVRA